MNGLASIELFSVAGIYFAILLYPLVSFVISVFALGLQVAIGLMQSRFLNKFYLVTVNIILLPALVLVGLDLFGSVYAILHDMSMLNWDQFTPGLALLGQSGFSFTSLLAFPILSRYIYRYYEHSIN